MPNISALGLDTSNYTTSAAFFGDGEIGQPRYDFACERGRRSDCARATRCFTTRASCRRCCPMLGDKHRRGEGHWRFGASA